MSEPRIGRVLVASMHQAILDVLPNRIEFYENWLTAAGLREGTIGLAPLSAVLSFLRLEGGAYDEVTTRAGEYAADWTISGLPKLERRIIQAMPASWRTRSALRVARAVITTTYPGTRTIMKRRGATVSVDLRGSLFCEVREASMMPLCGFYAAAISRVLAQLSLPADVTVRQCRAAGARQGCVLGVAFASADSVPAPAAETPETAE